MRLLGLFWCVLALLISLPASTQPAPYRNFKVAVYARAQEVRQMGDPAWLTPRWDRIARDLHVDHVWLETHRDMILVDDATIEKAKAFFASRGVRTSGGITWTISEPNRFETFCYSNPEHRAWVKKVIEHTARHFDEIILDDFFFTSCKSDIEIAAKGKQSWTQYRLARMTEAARNLVLAPAKAVNPKVRVIVKYPNWYAHFQGLGFNLATEPALFAGIYTGTETRDPVTTQQHLQPYLSYGIVRYFENIAPGRNLGGWVDPAASRYFDRYAEQLALTLFAKAPEITLFDFAQLGNAVTLNQRAPWHDQNPSFDFDAAVAGYRSADGTLAKDLSLPTPAGRTFAMLDPLIGQLGKPVGIAAYRPFHSSGEDFLHNFLGMIGLPIDLRPTWPADAQTVLLAEDAKGDPAIVSKIRTALVAGKNVVITSGLLNALQDKGLGDIVELRVSPRRALVQDFQIGFGAPIKGDRPILIPQVEYWTNDSWEDASAIDGWMGWPMLHEAGYSKGHLFVVTIPDNPANLYDLPQPLLNRIRQTVAKDMPVRLDAPAKVSLFTYDNGAFIVENFRDETVEVALVLDAKTNRLRDLQSNDSLEGTKVQAGGFRLSWIPSDAGKLRVTLKLKPHSFRAFRGE